MSEPLNLDAIEALCNAANSEVTRLCETYGNAFRMSIPPRSDRDSDLILSNALQTIPQLVTRVRELEAENARLRDAVNGLLAAMDRSHPSCGDLAHYSKREFHEYGEPCPVVAMVQAAINAAREGATDGK